jgi:predicted polyphosphate/ATP-dependent NAD kinase
MKKMGLIAKPIAGMDKSVGMKEEICKKTYTWRGGKL